MRLDTNTRLWIAGVILFFLRALGGCAVLASSDRFLMCLLQVRPLCDGSQPGALPDNVYIYSPSP